MTMAKEEYFHRLYALREYSDDDDDEGLDPDILTDLTAHSHSGQSLLREKLVRSPALIHSTSAPLVLSSPAIIEETPARSQDRDSTGITHLRNKSFVSETPLVHQLLKKRSLINRTLSDPNLSASTTTLTPSASMASKRKRKTDAIRVKPLEEQYLKDFVVYWIPPDAIAKTRRTRQNKACEHGAKLTFKWTPEITHVVADSDQDYPYEEVVRFLKPRVIMGSTRVVNDRFLMDCLKFRVVVPVEQKIYELKGAPSTVNGMNTNQIVCNSPLPSPEEEPDSSLELKASRNAPGKWDYVPPRATPARSEDSTQIAARDIDLQTLRGISAVSSADTNQDVESVSAHGKAIEPALHEESESSLPTSTPFNDELQNIIKELQDVSHLPLDASDIEEDAGTHEPGREDDSGDESDDPPPQRKAKRRKGTSIRGPLNQANFSCMKGGNAEDSAPGPNEPTIKILEQMVEYYGRSKIPQDQWRVYSYRKAIATLKRQTTRISTYDQAIILPQVGERLAIKITEIVATNRLRRLDNALAEPGDHALKLFMNIYGVGPSQAAKWVQQGHTTLQDLIEKVHLTNNQKTGIARFDDLNTRIPRAEVTALGKIVIDTAAKIDPDVQVVIGGSYRRGAATSGDIDCIITKPNTTKSREIISFLNQLTTQLTDDNFLVAALSVPSGDEGSKWHGCCKLPSHHAPHRPQSGLWRRIDFLLVPDAELGAALIYFTGNDIFNRSIRLLAAQKKMRLNQRGLYEDCMRGPDRVKVSDGRLVEGANERRIFEILGVPWREPRDRIC